MREYDESFESIFKCPKAIHLHSEDVTDGQGETEPKIDLKFLKNWDKNRDNTKDWKLDELKGDTISKSNFIDMFSKHCISIGREDEEYCTGFAEVKWEYGK